MKKICIWIARSAKLFFAVLCLWCLDAFAGPMNFFKGNGLEHVDAAADRYEYVGSNIVATGHVVVRLKDMQITADKAVINPSSEDMEMAGDVTFAVQNTQTLSVTLEKYEQMLQDPLVNVRLKQYVMSPSGEQNLLVQVTKNKMFMRAERIAGNLKTGVMQFRNFTMQMGVLHCSGKMAERLYNGEITVRDASFSTCEYLHDGHDHYSFFAKKAIISPRNTERGIFNYNADQGEHSIWAFNNTVRVFGVPLLWLPVLHKPKDLSSFGGKIELGSSSEWGYYIRTSKNFQLMDEPYLNANLMLDFYSERGFAYGLGLDFMTAESSTELFFYGMRDWKPYYYWEDNSNTRKWAENNSRLEIPHYRYEFRLSNLTHLLPNLDFRGQIDVLSDYNFLDEFFTARYNSVLEPPTYASLEYQGERYTASLYSSVRVNSFFTTVERIPEIRIDFQRQELFHNLYYQGETSFDYLSMKWREFDRPRTNPSLGDLENYRTGRLDSLHMLYYPFQMFNINVIPRAGFRLTAYSESSKRPVSDADLNNMFIIDLVDGQQKEFAYPYDSDGGAQLRFTGEIGIEANTKFHRAWQDIKNAYLDMDGLRHVMQPYVNYTYIPYTNVERDHLYYFDEIDRISKQNVVRLGLLNRLQTRRNSDIVQIFSLENYWDYFFYKEHGFNSIGDLGTILRITPTSNFSLTSELLLDLGQNNAHDYTVRRAGRDVGRPGLDWKFVNRWYNKLSYQIAPDWKITVSYEYCDDYMQRTPYSMGSMFSSINATSMFLNRFVRSQKISSTFEFPTIIDPRMKGAISFRYDIDAALMNDISLSLKRNFHCVDALLSAGVTEERGGNQKKSQSFYISFFLSLSAMPGVGIGHEMN